MELLKGAKNLCYSYWSKKINVLNIMTKLRIGNKTLLIPEEEKTVLVCALLEIVNYLQEENAKLKDEIQILKGEQGRPNIKPSQLNTPPGRKKGKDKKKKKGKKKKKTKNLKIHKTQILEVEEVSKGSTFKGYKDFIVQGIKLGVENVKYRREMYLTADGSYVIAPLPKELRGSHFSPELRSYILCQHYELHVTQHLIHKHLIGLGIDISEGQINNILIDGHDEFHQEKADILSVGLSLSNYVGVDDTGARHKGNNGYCTQIGNELFTWFESTGSKSRINFLELLRGGAQDYVVNSDARDYMSHQKLPKSILSFFEEDKFHSKESWESYLEEYGIVSERHIRIATEGALFGSILSHGINPELVILSDDAGQFNIVGFLNALCWIHAERILNKLIPYTENNRLAIEYIRDKIWIFYDSLKEYKKNPCESKRIELKKEFDEIFSSKTCFQSLNLALERIYNNKEELLLVLDRPEIPLHNNLSENDIRDYVKKRKISATTRSDAGRKARDTFLSLKKTSQKLGISFWDYLIDRVCKRNLILPLPDLIRAKANSP